MPNCPVCSQPVSGHFCSHCGFDLSRNYTQHPTFVPLDDTARAYCARTTPPAAQSAPTREQIDAQIIQYFLQAAKHMENGDYEAELQVLTLALALDPENTMTLVKLGRCYRALGFDTKALEVYRKVISLDPKFGQAYTNIGTVHLLKQNWAEAARYYEQGLPHIDRSISDYWVAYANYAVALARLGNRSQAKAMLQEAERHGYQNGNACRTMAGL